MKFPNWLQISGDVSYRNKKCPVESAEQITVFNYLRAHYPDTYGKIAVHPRNEGKRNHAQTSRQKAEGMTPGASDIIIPANGGLICELKRQDHTICSWEPGQKEYMEACQKLGAHVFLALGAVAFIEEFERWKN
jgi:hypothetical protein